MLAYDCEIVKAIQSKDERYEFGIDYCAGWNDFENMGISVICAYDWVADRYRVFCKDNLYLFDVLVAAHEDVIVSFNGINFDDKLCAANGLRVESSYDILRQAWIAAGLDPDKYNHGTHGGFGLDGLARANGLPGKTGHGARAPIDWQRGRIGRVIDYCLEDVRLTVELMNEVVRHGRLRDPRDPGEYLYMNSITKLQHQKRGWFG